MTATGKPGASLRAWRDYFPAATIYGADIDQRVLFQEERIHTFQVDQTNAASVQTMLESIGTTDFDLMIDDGLHEFQAGKTLFERSIEKLSWHGLYVIEDVTATDLIKYLDYFAEQKYWVTLIQCPRSTNRLVSDNALVLVRRTGA